MLRKKTFYFILLAAFSFASMSDNAFAQRRAGITDEK